MDWTLGDIKSKVRRLTGRPDQGQLSNQDLEDAINRYYVNMLPQEVRTRESETWHTFTTSLADEGEYALPDTILAVGAPFTTRDLLGVITSMEMTTDPQHFFTVFPESETARSRPLSCLLYNRTIYVRPKADGPYTIKALALKTFDPMASDEDKPVDSKWGPMIAYGAAIEILQENGEDSEADSLKDLYGRHLFSTARKQLQQIPSGTRATPAF